MKTRIVIDERLKSDRVIDARREASDGSYLLVVADLEIAMSRAHAMQLIEAIAREEAVGREVDLQAQARMENPNTRAPGPDEVRERLGMEKRP